MASTKATDLLAEDHETLKQLFAQCEGATPGERADIFQQVWEELLVHGRVEEDLFYPELAKAGEAREKIEQAVREHQRVEQQVDDLRTLGPTDERFGVLFAEVRREVLQHIDEEEGEIFPLAERLLGEGRLAAIGRSIQSRREQVMPETIRKARRRAYAS